MKIRKRNVRSVRQSSYGARRFSCEYLEERIALSTVTLELDQFFRTEGQIEGLGLADFDGDGNVDWLTTLTPNGTERVEGSNLALFKNDGDGNLEFSHLINPESDQRRPVNIFSVGDMDNDGDQDIVSLSLSELFWEENDGSGNFERHAVGGFESCVSLFDDFEAPSEFIQATDYDRDGDLDIVSNFDTCSSGFENLGDGEFAAREDFAIGTSGYTTAIDFEDDGDIDFISINSSETTLFVNDGAGSFREVALAHDDSGFKSRAWALFDLDGDGVREPVSTLTWLALLEGSGINFPPKVAVDKLDWVATANLDSDGQIDHFVIQENYGLGGFFVIHWIEDTLGDLVFHWSPESFVGNNKLGRLSNHGIVTDTQVVDIDQDGDDDLFVLATSCSITGLGGECAILIENHLTGDSNHDGVFDSSDLVTVFQAGKYEDGIPGNASFEEGDWNLDGEFDSGDLVLAFQVGHYEKAAAASSNEVAAAVEWMFALGQDLEKPSPYVP